MSNRAELLARAFLNLHIAVAEIVRRADPIGLVKSGAPDDEYDAEVDRILVRLRAAKTESDVARIASDVFHERLCPESELPDGMAEGLAKAIWPVWLASPCR